MREIAEREQPDLMLVDGICCDTAELAQVEYVTTHHPSLAVILLCSTHTPEFLINSMRAGVREVLPSPVTAPALEAAVGRVAAKLVGAPTRKTGKVLAFMPCKGGAGATFLATNLGWQLAETKSVLLIDLNLQFGDALSFVHDGKAPSTLADVAKDISRLDASLLAASTVKVAPNYSILAAPEDLAHAMEVKPEHIDAILSLAVTQYDFVLLDVPRSLDTIGDQGAGSRLAHLPRPAVRPARLAQCGQAAGGIQVAGLPPGQDRADHQPLRQDQRHRPRPGPALAGQRAPEHRAQLLPRSERVDQSRRSADQDGSRQHRGQAPGRFCTNTEPAPGRNPRGGLLGRLFRRA